MLSINLPIYSSPYYSYTISLQGNNYEFTFLWIEKSGFWYLDISKEDGTSIVKGEKLVPYYPILDNYRIDGLTGYIWLQAFSPDTVYGDVARNLSDYYFLSYIY